MNLIYYFEKLHITVKSTFLTILGQMPFFFISVYLFNHKLVSSLGENLFYDIDFLFIISLCFCLSLTWFSMNLILSFISVKFGDRIYNDDTEIGDVFKLSTIYSIGYLSLAIFINYKIGFNFFWFLAIAYGFIVFRIIWVGVVWYIYSYKEKKKENQTPHKETEQYK